MSTKELISIKLSIFDPGQNISEGWLESIEYGFWILPKECKYVWDCVKPLNTEKYYVVEHNKPKRLEYRNNYIFTKWAVYVSFDYMGEIMSNTFHNVESIFEYEAQYIGEEYLFRSYQDDILELADPLLEQLEKRKLTWDTPRYGLQFVTVWEYRTFRCNSYFEPEEWDSEWELLGLVDFSKLDSVIALPASQREGGAE